MEKLDYKAKLKHLYACSAKQAVVVDVPAMNFLCLDGVGNPNTSPHYQAAVQALFSVSYAIKFKLKRERGIDYGVLPLEGQWWTDDMSRFSVDDKDAWQWTLMIMQPDVVRREVVELAIEEVGRKKNLAALPALRFSTFAEGRAAQLLHVGPFSAEGPTVQKLHDFIAQQGSRLRGKHHEIYLSDIRRAAPEKWKTIIRQPMT